MNLYYLTQVNKFAKFIVMNLKEKMIEKVALKNEKGLASLLIKNLSEQKNLNGMGLEQPVSELRIQHFLRGLAPLVSELNQKRAMEVKLLMIQTLFDHWDYSLSLVECFVIYNLKDLGRFRLKEDKLFNQLMEQWSSYPDYKVERSDLKQILKDLKNLKVIELRRGTVLFASSMILR